MFYNRALAMAFAEDFWDRPCKSNAHPLALGLDGGRDVPLESVWNHRLAPLAAYDPMFVYNPASDRDDLVGVPKPGARAKDGSALPRVTILDGAVKGHMIEDCAHFLSRCLIAGGVTIKEQWSVPMLLIALQESEDNRPMPIAKTLAEKVSPQAAQRVIDAGLLHIGDMIGYFAGGAYQHSAMYTGVHDGKGRVTCHTKSRFMGLTPPQVSDAWFLSNPNYQFTLMHIPSHLPPLAGKAMAGWWEIKSAAGSAFYCVQADGRAIRTTKKPKSVALIRQPAMGDSRGYWFSDLGKVQFCWRADGQVVRFTLTGAQTSARVALDGGGSGSATKL